jgi:hypothetical protein
MRNSTRFLMAGIIIFLGIAAFAVVNVLTRNTLVSGEAARGRIEAVLGTSLPFEADLLAFDGRRMRFAAPPPTIELVLAQAEKLCFALPLPANGERAVTGNDVYWWLPDAAQTYVSATCGENPTYRILVDTTYDNVWVVYLEVA